MTPKHQRRLAAFLYRYYDRVRAAGATVVPAEQMAARWATLNADIADTFKRKPRPALGGMGKRSRNEL